MYRLIIWVFVLSISICSTALGQPSTPPEIMAIGTGRTSNQPNQGHIRYYVGVINWVDYEELFPTYKTIVRDNYGRSMTWNLSNASSLALLYMSLPVAETPPIYIYVELYDDTDPESPSVYTSNIVFRPPIEYIMRINVATIPNWQRVEGGNVHLSPEPHEGLNNPGVLSYTQGQVVHLTANPISNHLFDGWYGNLTGTANPETIVMNSDKMVSAHFQRAITFEIDVFPADAGSVRVSPNKLKFLTGEQVTFTAIPATGYSFVEWMGQHIVWHSNVMYTNNPVTIPLIWTDNPSGHISSYDTKLTAKFIRNEYRLTTSVSPAGGGSVSRSPNKSTYFEGEIVRVTANPNTSAGYRFVNWTGTAVAAGKVANPSNASTTVTMDGNYTLVANFELIEYTLTVIAGDGGRIVRPGTIGSGQSGSFTYPSGTIVTVEVRPDSNYSFNRWTGTADSSGKVANPTALSTTVTMDDDYTLRANFSAILSVQIYDPKRSSWNNSHMVLYNPASNIPSPKLTLNAKAQPLGSDDFVWRVTKGRDKVQFVQNPNSYEIRGADEVQLQAVAQSTDTVNNFDVEVVVTYTVGTQSVTSPSHYIVVHKPTSLDKLPVTPLIPEDGFLYQIVYNFALLDQFRKQIPIADIPGNESFKGSFCQNANRLYKPDPKDHKTDEFGFFGDQLGLREWWFFWSPSPTLIPVVLRPTPQNYVMKREQEISFGGWPDIDNRCQTFTYFTAISVRGQCGPCPPQVIAINTTQRFESPQTRVQTVHVDQMMSDVTFHVSWTGSNCAVVIESPDGSLIDPTTAQENENMDYMKGPASASYTIREAQAGDWQVVITASDVGPDGADYSIVVTGDSDLKLELSVPPAGWRVYESIPIGANMLSDGVALGGFDITAKMERPDGTVDELILYDDGAHGDGTSNDGYYANTYTGSSVVGMYTVTASATGTIGNELFERAATTKIYVGDCPDLAVEPSFIQFSDDTPAPGQRILIVTAVENNGFGNADDAVVCFYDGQPGTGELLAQRLVDIDAGQSEIVEAAWIVPAGEHEVFVALYPSDQYFEENYENNVASRLIDAGPADPNDSITVDFLDPELKAAVEAALGVTDPNSRDMLGLGSLSSTGSGIESLIGLEYAPNLQQLNLVANEISRIDPLLGLVLLEELDLSHNMISDIESLSNMTGLKSLTLTGNRIEDTDPLSGLKRLEILHVNANRITDLSPIGELSGLQSLDLSNNRISDISDLLELRKLTTLNLTGNPLSDTACNTHIPQIIANNPGIELKYDEYQYTITFSASEGGTVRPPSSGPLHITVPWSIGEYKFTYGCEQSLEALPDDGYEFVGWSGTLVDSGKINPSSSSVTFVVDGDYTLRANFDRIQSGEDTYCALTISSTEGGSVSQIVSSGTDPVPDGIYTLPYDTELAYVPVTDDGYWFDSWTGTLLDAGKIPGASAWTSVNFTLDGDHTLVANFIPIPPVVGTLTVSSAGGGYVRGRYITTAQWGGGDLVMPYYGDYECREGCSFHLTPQAFPGYHFVQWTGTAVDTGIVDPASSGVEFTIDADYTIVANFEAD